MTGLMKTKEEKCVKPNAVNTKNPHSKKIRKANASQPEKIAVDDKEEE